MSKRDSSEDAADGRMRKLTGLAWLLIPLMAISARSLERLRAC